MVLLQNALQCPDGLILKSLSTHDCQVHGQYMIDGGMEYVRSSIDGKLLTLTSDSTYMEILIQMAVDISTGGPYNWRLASTCSVTELVQARSNIERAFPKGGGYIICLTLSCINYWLVQRMATGSPLSSTSLD